MIWRILSIGTFLFAWFALGYSIGELRGYEKGKAAAEAECVQTQISPN